MQRGFTMARPARPNEQRTNIGYAQSVHSTPSGLISAFAAWDQFSPNTAKVYARHVMQFARWLEAVEIGSASLMDATPKLVRDYMHWLEFFSPANLAAASRKAHLSAISAFYRWLIYIDAIETNPCTDIKRPRVKRDRGAILEGDELELWLRGKGTPRDRAMAWLLYYTGARADELRNMLWSNIDWADRLISVQGKGEIPRVIAISDKLANQLMLWRSIQLDQAARKHPEIAKALERPDTAFVLLTRTGQRLSANEIWRATKKRCLQNGIRVVDGKTVMSPHAMRRTMGTRMLRAGHTIDTVADVLGHKSIDTTRTHYAFASTASAKAAMESL